MSTDGSSGPASIRIGARLRSLGADDLDVVAATHALVGDSPELLELVVDALHAGTWPPTPGDVRRLEEQPPAAVVARVRSRLTELDPSIIEIAEAAAVLGGRATVARIARLGGRTVPDVAGAVGVLADAGLVAGGVPTFRHPIEAAATRSLLEPDAAVRLHHRAAELLHAQGAPVVDIATHLLAAGPTGFTWAASVLRHAARLNRTEGPSPITLLRAALDEPLAETERLAALEELGIAEAAAGDPRCIGRFRALAATGGGAARLRLARALAAHADPRGAVAELDEMLAGEDDPGHRRQIERHLLTILRQDLELRPRSAPLVERLTAELRTDPDADATLLAELAYEHALSGTAATTVLELATRAIGPATRGELAANSAHVLFLGLLWAGDHVAARRLVRARDQLGDSSVIGELRCAALALEAGAPAVAAVHAQAGLDASARHVPLMAPSLTAMLARCQLRLGEADRAAETLRPVLRDASLRSLVTFHPVLLADAEVRWGLGDAEAALRSAEDCAQFSDRMGTQNPVAVPWQPVAAEALEALGRRDEAVALAREALERVAVFGYGPERIVEPLRGVVERAGRRRYTPSPDRAVRVLGDPSLTIGSRTVPLADDLVDRMLRYLAVHDRPVHREELIELFWPDIDPDVGRARLRKLLSRLRQRHGDLVPGSRPHLALAEDVEVDLRRFHRCAADAANGADPTAALHAARRALELAARGEPCLLDRYEDWAIAVVEEFRRVRDRTAARAEGLSASPRHDPAPPGHPSDATPA